MFLVSDLEKQQVTLRGEVMRNRVVIQRGKRVDNEREEEWLGRGRKSG